MAQAPAQDRPPFPAELRVLVAAAFVIAIGFGLVSPVLPAYARSFDVGVAAASFVVSIFAFFRLVFAPAGGALVQRLGEPHAAVREDLLEALLLLDRRREELREHPVRGVEHVHRQVVTAVDEPGLQAAADTVDDGAALLSRTPLEREQVDVEDLAHGRERYWRAQRRQVSAGAQRSVGAPPAANSDGAPPVCRNTTSSPRPHRPVAALPSRPANPLPL